MRSIRLPALSLFVITACSTPEPRPAHPTVVTITATDYAFSAPDTIRAGFTTFRLVNQGKELHHASLVRLGAGKTLADFQAGLQAAMKSHAPPPAWLSFMGGPNAIAPGDTTTATHALSPGSYILICWIPSADGVPHVMKGMLHPLTVSGPPPTAAVSPAADVVVKLSDYDFQFEPALAAGTHTIRVENLGPQAHEIVIAALEPGKTVQDLIAWEMAGEKGPPPTGRWLGGVATLDARRHAQFTATFTPGNYVVLCFWPDAKDGRTHIAHGMAKQLTVS